MASSVTYRSGDTKPMTFQTAPLIGGVQLYPIEKGDLLIVCKIVAGGVTYHNCVVPAHSEWATGITSIQALGGSSITSANLVISTVAGLKAAFAGVAMHKSGLQRYIPMTATAAGEQTFKLTSDPGYQLVATAGRFEFPCASTTWYPGDLVMGYLMGSSAGYGNQGNNYANIVHPQQVAKSDKQVADTPSDGGVNSIGYAAFGFNQLNTAVTSVIVEIRPIAAHAQFLSGE
jgi:hypothetical protein